MEFRHTVEKSNIAFELRMIMRRLSLILVLGQWNSKSERFTVPHINSRIQYHG